MIGCDRLYIQIQRVQNSCTHRILGLNLTSLAYTDTASEHGDRKVERESYSRYDQHNDGHQGVAPVMMEIMSMLWRWRSKAQDDDGHIMSQF